MAVTFDFCMALFFWYGKKKDDCLWLVLDVQTGRQARLQCNSDLYETVTICFQFVFLYMYFSVCDPVFPYDDAAFF